MAYAAVNLNRSYVGPGLNIPGCLPVTEISIRSPAAPKCGTYNYSKVFPTMSTPLATVRMTSSKGVFLVFTDQRNGLHCRICSMRVAEEKTYPADSVTMSNLQRILDHPSTSSRRWSIQAQLVERIGPLLEV